MIDDAMVRKVASKEQAEVYMAIEPKSVYANSTTETFEFYEKFYGLARHQPQHKTMI